MNVIVFSKRHGRARQIELGRPLALTVMIAAVLAVLSGVLFAGVQLGRSGKQPGGFKKQRPTGQINCPQFYRGYRPPERKLCCEY